MTIEAGHVPVTLGSDAEANRVHLQHLLDSAGGGTLVLPSGTYPLDRGLTVPAGWTVRGTPAGGTPTTWLTVDTPGDRPVLHVTGGHVAVVDLGLRPAPSRPGEHDGDRGTGLTVGRYLYPDEPEWIDTISVRRVHVDHGTNRAANAVAIMGAVRDVRVRDVTVTGGHTAVAVHWGAIGSRVDTITGPSYHPHRLDLTGVRVRDAVEGFYLSAVHDVAVDGACLRGVDMGFRLLAGDNTDRFHKDPAVRIGERIDIRDVCITWTGPLYGIRVAGWGRSEVDGMVSHLTYADTTLRDIVLRRPPATSAPTPAPTPAPTGTPTGIPAQAAPAATGVPTRAAQRGWSPLLMEYADPVTLTGIRIEPPATPCCPLA
ncbi:hypothetical protein ABT336_15090 [Micromonospora sp. NPDC000207]|uniref:hypothetical protein n=1 Tax=Micromonospora sp. NPDC000207 TaxID=3154246 RepID=UPI00331CBBA1